MHPKESWGKGLYQQELEGGRRGLGPFFAVGWGDCLVGWACSPAPFCTHTPHWGSW